MKNKLIAAIIALLASLCLWFYVVTVVNPEDTTTIYGIPVTFVGEEQLREEQGYIITDGVDASVDLKIHGRRAVFQKLGTDNITVMIDVSKIRKPGSFKMSYNVVLPNDVSSTDATVISRSPGSVSFTVERLIRKPIAVKGVLDGEVAENYMSDPMTFNYSEIMIEGPEALVNTVSYAQVILKEDNLDRTVTATLPFSLIDEYGNIVEAPEISCNVEEIEVTLPVLAYKDLKLAVDCIEGGGATADDVIIYTNPEIITVAGDPVILEELNQIKLGNIDLAGIPDNGAEFTMPIPLPDGLRNISGEEKADVSITLRGLSSKKLRLGKEQMRFVNVPEGYKPCPQTSMIQATVRAATAILPQISAEDLIITADLASITKEGSYTVPVTITCKTFEDAGVLGEYSIVVSLREDVPEPEPEVTNTEE